MGRICRLLQRAEVPLGCIRGVEAQGGWKDPLRYTDGCEWAVMRLDEDFVPPAHCHTEAFAFCALPEVFHPDFIQALPINVHWSAWYYVPVDDMLPFDEREWVAALYDGESCRLAVYRGYALYGID